MEDNKKFTMYDKELADKVNKEAKEQARLKQEQIDIVRSLVNKGEKKKED